MADGSDLIVSKFVLEPEDFYAPGEEIVPVEAGGLLHLLGLHDADLAEQRAGVAGWLADNDADELMLRTLRARGLLDGLPSRA